jgi:hypothetical protein
MAWLSAWRLCNGGYNGGGWPANESYYNPVMAGCVSCLSANIGVAAKIGNGNENNAYQ